MTPAADIQARVGPSVRRRVREYLSRIADLSQPFRYMGARFTFDADTDLDDAVNAVLVALGDILLDDFGVYMAEAAAEAGSGDDADAIVSVVLGGRDGETAQDRVDRHSARLRYSTEGGLAISFANGMPKRRTLNEVMASMDNRRASKLWTDAERGGAYSATILRDGDLLSGRGVMHSVVKSYALVGETMIREAFVRGSVLRYGRDGAVGYRVFRNSTFDCPLCDSLCVSVHPLSEIVLPAHPRCCCVTKPVYAGEQ